MYPPPQVKNPARVEEISQLRMKAFQLLLDLEKVIESKPECIAELIIAKREIQSARHWMGESLGFYETDFEPKDISDSTRTSPKE